MSSNWYTRSIICVADVERSLAFYTDKLAFAEAWRHEEDGQLLVAQVDRAGCELILLAMAGEGRLGAYLHLARSGRARRCSR